MDMDKKIDFELIILVLIVYFLFIASVIFLYVNLEPNNGVIDCGCEVINNE